MKKDIYQERYLAHQQRKKEMLTSNYGKKVSKLSKNYKIMLGDLFKRRSSQRVFNNEDLSEKELKEFLSFLENAPSSCDRKGVSVRIITERDDKALLSGLLVGGVGWVYRAQAILLLLADKKCYKSPAEKEIMPYLDTGVIIQTCYLTAEVFNLGCCFVNPNIREKNKEFFRKSFGIEDDLIFCGAVVIGKYDKKNI